MTVSTDPSATASLASADLPLRVRRTLERALTLVSEELDHGMERMLLEFERELFRLADLARNPGSESGYMQALRSFRLNRADLLPRFMIQVETGLAGLRGPAAAAEPVADDSEPPSFRHLSLVETSVMDEDTVLAEVASRQEGRATLALHLLGQRFGVLAGSPAFDAGRLPLGPLALCRAIRTAAVELELSHDARLLLYRMFDRQVMSGYPQVLDHLNNLLAEEGILPSLTFVPMRMRPTPVDAPSAPRAEPHDEPGHASAPGQAASGNKPPPRLHTAWMGQAPSGGGEDDDDAVFGMLQQLLSGRRELIDKLKADKPEGRQRQMSTPDLVGALRGLQQAPAANRASLAEVKRTILAQARQQYGEGSALSPQDSDTFELVHLLYEQIEKEIRLDAPTSPLVRELQVPLLRLALQDRGFFLHASHPARQLLNTIAESAARWTDRNELDRSMVEPLKRAVADVVEEFDDDPAVFARANEGLQQQLQTQVRKAETLEKRHVEAARGKEKLEVARQRAAEVLEESIGGRRLPRFARALLNQAWADVLTLTLLRQGEGSEAWRQQLQATGEIIAACASDEAPGSAELTAHVESSLSQVGYHDDEAGVIAQRLTAATDEDDEDPASRTELAMKLKARVRLGEDKVKAEKPKLPPRTGEEQAHYEQLRTLPFGCWVEFTTNQQGDVVRRRLSWYSRVTDNALFVNQRGQRVAEHSLDSLARMIVAGQARLVTAERGRLVDRAWQAAVNALRSFAGRGEDPANARAPA